MSFHSTFLQVVILIDKYEFHEVAEVFTDMSFEFLWKAIPRNSSPDLAHWIYICWVLRKEPEFKTLTRIAQYEKRSRFEDGDILFPDSIAGKSTYNMVTP
jgi:hypothetical protein